MDSEKIQKYIAIRLQHMGHPITCAHLDACLKLQKHAI